MILENVVLVRAMNNLPLDGNLIPSCEGNYLKKDNKSDFYYVIYKIVKRRLEQELGRYLEDWEESDRELIKNAMDKYTPYTSFYTSTLSFSLNGLVPDDINNNFSNMKLAVIDPIKYHLDEDYVNVDVIDTTIKGSIKVSPEAILVIEQEYFMSLSEEIKTNLLNSYKIELFNGRLKDAVSQVLQKYNYPSLPLVQKKEEKDILDCDEKESMIAFENSFAIEHSASRLKLQQLYMYPIDTMGNTDQVAAEKVKSDIEKNQIIEKYYRNLLYRFLIEKANLYGISISEEDEFYLLSDFSNSSEVLENLINSIINSVGFEKIKEIINEFNQSILDNYLTNEDIVALEGESRK